MAGWRTPPLQHWSGRPCCTWWRAWRGSCRPWKHSRSGIFFLRRAFQPSTQISNLIFYFRFPFLSTIKFYSFMYYRIRQLCGICFEDTARRTRGCRCEAIKPSKVLFGVLHASPLQIPRWVLSTEAPSWESLGWFLNQFVEIPRRDLSLSASYLFRQKPV